MTADRVNYITAAATWDPCYCQAISAWSVTTPCADVKSDRWYPCSHARPPRPAATQVAWTTHYACTWVVHMIHSTPHTWVVQWRAWQRRQQSNYINDHSWRELPHSDSIDRVPNESREIYFPPRKFISWELTTLVYLHSFSCCWLPNLRNLTK